MKRTPETILTAVNNAKQNNKKLCDTYGQSNDINMSSIYSKLINEAGRWCTSYASDLLYDIKAIDDYIKTPTLTDTPKSHVFAIGFRESGVDGNDFVISRLEDTMDHISNFCYPEKIYRQLYAVEVIKEPYRTIATLYDIYHETYKFETSDKTK